VNQEDSEQNEVDGMKKGVDYVLDNAKQSHSHIAYTHLSNFCFTLSSC